MNNKIVPCKLLFIYSVFYETKGENRFLQGSSRIELHCEVSFYGASRLALLSLVSPYLWWLEWGRGIMVRFELNSSTGNFSESLFGLIIFSLKGKKKKKKSIVWSLLQLWVQFESLTEHILVEKLICYLVIDDAVWVLQATNILRLHVREWDIVECGCRDGGDGPRLRAVEQRSAGSLLPVRLVQGRGPCHHPPQLAQGLCYQHRCAHHHCHLLCCWVRRLSKC